MCGRYLEISKEELSSQGFSDVARDNEKISICSLLSMAHTYHVIKSHALLHKQSLVSAYTMCTLYFSIFL